MVMGMAMGMGMKNRYDCLAKVTGVLLASLSSNLALAQVDSGTQNQAFVIKPRIALTETWTDNVAVGGGQNSKESGFITQVAPGIRIDAKTARLKAYLDYALTGSFYSTSSASNRTPKIIFLNKKSQKSKVKNLIKCLLIAFVLL